MEHSVEVGTNPEENCTSLARGQEVVLSLTPKTSKKGSLRFGKLLRLAAPFLFLGYSFLPADANSGKDIQEEKKPAPANTLELKDGIPSQKPIEENIASLTERRVISYYQVKSLQVVENRLAAVITELESNNPYVVMGDFKNPIGGSEPKSAGKLDIYPTSVTMSEINPDLTIIFGSDEKPNPMKMVNGRLLLSEDGGLNWALKPYTEGHFMSGQITPDLEKVIIKRNDPNNEGWPAYLKLDLITGEFAPLTVVDDGNPVNPQTALQIMKTGHYVNYGYKYFYPGYTEFIYQPDGKIETIQHNLEVGYPVGSLTQSVDQEGNLWIGVLNNDDTDNGNRGVFTYYLSKNHNLMYRVRPNMDLHPEAGTSRSVLITAAALDHETKIGYMVVSVNVNGTFALKIETFSLDDPDDRSKHKLINLNPSCPVSSTSTSDPNRFLRIVKIDSEKYLVFDKISDNPADNGLYIIRITDGLDSLNEECIKITPVEPEKESHKAFIPLVSKN